MPINRQEKILFQVHASALWIFTFIAGLMLLIRYSTINNLLRLHKAKSREHDLFDGTKLSLDDKQIELESTRLMLDKLICAEKHIDGIQKELYQLEKKLNTSLLGGDTCTLNYFNLAPIPNIKFLTTNSDYDYITRKITTLVSDQTCSTDSQGNYNCVDTSYYTTDDYNVPYLTNIIEDDQYIDIWQGDGIELNPCGINSWLGGLSIVPETYLYQNENKELSLHTLEVKQIFRARINIKIQSENNIFKGTINLPESNFDQSTCLWLKEKLATTLLKSSQFFKDKSASQYQAKIKQLQNNTLPSLENDFSNINQTLTAHHQTISKLSHEQARDMHSLEPWFWCLVFGPLSGWVMIYLSLHMNLAEHNEQQDLRASYHV